MFAKDLDYSLSHIRGLFSSHVIYHAINLGLFEKLEASSTVKELAIALAVKPDVLSAMIDFLVREELVNSTATGLGLTERGRAVQRCAGWFIELVGGYGDVVRGLNVLLT